MILLSPISFPVPGGRYPHKLSNGFPVQNVQGAAMRLVNFSERRIISKSS